jgi:hypothetical protein
MVELAARGYVSYRTRVSLRYSVPFKVFVCAQAVLLYAVRLPYLLAYITVMITEATMIEGLSAEKALLQFTYQRA